MRLTRIDTGAVEEVAVPEQVVLTKAEGNVVKRWVAPATDQDALDSWCYRHGYEVPGAIEEATATVKQHTAHSKRGKTFIVRQYQRQVTSNSVAWAKGMTDKAQVQDLLAHTTDPETNLYLRGQIAARELDYVMDDAEAPAAKIKARVNQMVQRVDDAIERYQLPKDTTVFRGMGYERKPTWLKVGTVMRDKAWVSTSPKASVAREMIDEYGETHSILLQVRLPKGTNAAPVYALKKNQFRYQQELLLRRNSAFKIKSVKEKVHKEEGEVIGKSYLVEAEYVR